MIKNIKKALIITFPVFLGYIFLGIAFGVLFSQVTDGVYKAFLSSLFIYGGSLQFALVAFVRENTPILSIAIISLLISSRQIFYGISLLEKYNKMGKYKPYMIFSLTDETYALLCSLKDKEDKTTLFLISLFNHSYWILGSVIGFVLGDIIPFNTKGIDFVMTALFVTILVEQYETYKNHFIFYLAFAAGIVSLLIFGADNFLLPSILITVSVILWRNKR